MQLLVVVQLGRKGAQKISFNAEVIDDPSVIPKMILELRE